MDQDWRNHIEGNIAHHGFHLYFVAGGQTPRFAYTIGLSETLGFECIIAGCAFYSDKELVDVINTVAKKCLETGEAPEPSIPLAEIGACGTFHVRDAHESWASKLALGTCDYYGVLNIRFFQLIPDGDHETLDVPNMEIPWDGEGAWQWLDTELPEGFPDNSSAVTNLDALQGYFITECTRWEPNEWEIFSGNGPDVRQEDMRVVPLGVLLGIDPTLSQALRLELGKLAYRTYEERSWIIG